MQEPRSKREYQVARRFRSKMQEPRSKREYQVAGIKIVRSTKYNVPSTFKTMIAVGSKRTVRFLGGLAPLREKEKRDLPAAGRLGDLAREKIPPQFCGTGNLSI
jgi:hypothetical protein